MIKLGQGTIISLTQGDRPANLCNEQYAKLRDNLLRDHTWGFATARAKLGQLDDAPAFGFDNAYQLPANWLRTITVHDNDAGVGAVVYRTAGRTLESNASALYLRYVKQVTDPNEMDAAFREALAYMLAADLAMALAQSTTLMEKMEGRFAAALSSAASTGSIEDYPEAWPESDWITVRGQSGAWGHH